MNHEKIEFLEELEEHELKEEPKENKKRKPSKVIWLLLGIAIILIVVGIILSISKNESSDTTNKSSKSNSDTKEELKGNYKEYSGYSFFIPEGYEAEEKEGYGIIITDHKNVIYTIFTDYTNSYDMYKTHLMTLYPNQANDIVATIAKREYLALIEEEEETSSYGTMFVTKTNSKTLTTLIGMVVRSDYTPATTQEFRTLTKIINNTKPVTDKKEIVKDFGQEGIRVIGYKKENYTFTK